MPASQATTDPGTFGTWDGKRWLEVLREDGDGALDRSCGYAALPGLMLGEVGVATE